MTLYQYLFYKLYKFTEEWGFWPVARAFCLVIILNVVLLGSLLNYFIIITGIYIRLPEGKIWIYIIASILTGINYLLLLRGNKKDEIIEYFDKMPRKKNDIGSIIVFVGVILLIVLYVYSLFILDH